MHAVCHSQVKAEQVDPIKRNPVIAYKREEPKGTKEFTLLLVS